MRTTEIGWCTPPNGTTPGMRRPVRTITLPPISSRRIRFGEPTSPRVSGVTVAPLSPRPCWRIAAAASCTTRFLVARRLSSERSKRGSSSSRPITSGASTRSDSSSSSWPVWSPSRTTIDFSSTAAKISGGPPAGSGGEMARSMGWRREGSKRRFRYLDAAGRPITDEAKLERINSLAIPPAWKDVWIAPTARSKLQATGVDAAGRKQYLYHPDFRARAGAGEVRQADPLRRAVAAAARGDGRAHGARRAAARTGRGDRGPADQPRLVPRRHRPLRQGLAHLRDHDASRSGT